MIVVGRITCFSSLTEVSTGPVALMTAQANIRNTFFDQTFPFSAILSMKVKVPQIDTGVMMTVYMERPC